MAVVHEPPHETVGKVLRCERGPEEACESNADLDGGEEACGLCYHFKHFFSAAVARFYLFFQLILVQRYHCDLGCREERIE